MTSTKLVAIKAEELRSAFEFVSFGLPFENSAYFCLDTGRIYLHSDSIDVDDGERLPEDVDDLDRYIAVPHKNDLDLGRHLVLAFVNQELPDDYDTVAGFFRRKGAYARFKDLLHARGVLERWYEFENRATEEALLAWCEENGIQPTDD
jgi:hypothetical protein